MQRENHRKAVSESDTASEGEGDCAMSKMTKYVTALAGQVGGGGLEDSQGQGRG